MQENDYIKESNQAIQYHEPDIKTRTTSIILQGANPKVRWYPICYKFSWIDIPIFL